MKAVIIVSLFFCNLCVFGQTTPAKPCRYPFDVSADSLVKFVIREVYKPGEVHEKKFRFNSKNIRQHFYDPSLPVNFDSVFRVCINHLKANLGEKFACQNVDMYLNSFAVYEKKYFQLSFGFTYPVLKREKPQNIGTFVSHFERININYNYSLIDKNKVEIEYPTNIPACKDLENCGIIYTKEKAIDILKFWGLLKENDKIYMAPHGLNWDITLTDNDWVFRKLSLHLQTGQLSNFRTEQRID